MKILLGWPDFPMTRAVVLMDVIQELTINNIKPTDKFFISGASKRGLDDWTTAAVDDRVVGIAPLVIDLLNVIHHLNAITKLMAIGPTFSIM